MEDEKTNHIRSLKQRRELLFKLNKLREFFFLLIKINQMEGKFTSEDVLQNN